MRRLGPFALACTFAAMLLAATPLQALESVEEEQLVREEQATYAPAPIHDDHDPESGGHPLRLVAYAVHPVGVALDWILVRPATWVVRHEPFRTIFGYRN